VVDFRSYAPDEDLPTLADWYPWPAGRDSTVHPLILTTESAPTADTCTPSRLMLTAVIEQDDWLFTRYVRDVDQGGLA
jgi:hypothetical protein